MYSSRMGSLFRMYNDKHLSYSLDTTKRMVAASKRLDFPMVAGSSLPHTWRLPDLELPLSCEIEEVVMSAAGGPDAHVFHGLEGLQALIERRSGGETGVHAVQLLRGDDVWRAMEEGRWSNRLLEAALSRSDEVLGIPKVDARPQDLIGSGVMPGSVDNPGLDHRAQRRAANHGSAAEPGGGGFPVRGETKRRR